MKTSLASLMVMVLVTLFGCGKSKSDKQGGGTEKSQFPMTKSSPSEKVVLLGIKRGVGWPDAEAAPGSSLMDIPAGQDLLVIRYQIDEVQGATMPTPITVSLTDASGAEHQPSADVITSVNGEGVAATQRGFLVPAGSRLGVLAINATRFELGELDPRPATLGAW